MNRGNPQHDRLALWLIPLVTMLAFAPVVSNGWVNWDDPAYVVNNHLMNAPDGLWRMWFTWESKDYYPLTFTCLFVQHAFWQSASLGYHVVSLVLHLLNAVVYYGVSRRLGMSPLPALWVSLVFAVHPVQVESVAWITEQKNLLYALFGGLTLLSYFQYRETSQIRWLLAALVLFAAGMLSKAMLVSLPAVIILCDWLQKRRWKWQHALSIGLFFAVALLLAFNLVRQQAHMVADRGIELHHDMAERAAIVGRALWFYPWKLIWPADLVAIYPLWKVNDASPAQSYLPLAAMILIVAGAIWLHYRGLIDRWIPFALLYYLVTIAPVTGLADTSYMEKSFVADRYQYTSCLGWLWLVAALFRGPASRWPKTILSLAALTLILLTCKTWQQIPVWKNAITLWTHSIDHAPGSAFAFNNRGDGWLDQGEWDRAETDFRQALKLDPHLGAAYVGLGVAHLARERDKQAEEALQKALALRPALPSAHYHLGRLRLRKGDREGAIESFRDTLRYDPFHRGARGELRYLLPQEGR